MWKTSKHHAPCAWAETLAVHNRKYFNFFLLCSSAKLFILKPPLHGCTRFRIHRVSLLFVRWIISSSDMRLALVLTESLDYTQNKIRLPFFCWLTPVRWNMAHLPLNNENLPPYAKRSPIQKCKNFVTNMLHLGSKFVST